ncbi:hypothetical protein QJQ45_020870 [Haematococcus lacustris]|nr:hypothetical protein QJQ45_020870 [Haematococcus lacustris]
MSQQAILARSQVPQALLLRVLEHAPALRIQADSQLCDQLLTPHVVAALQARTSKLALTLQQPEAQASGHYAEVLSCVLATLGSCAAVEACKLSGRAPRYSDAHVATGIGCEWDECHCTPGLALSLLDSFPGLTALTLHGFSVTCSGLASLLQQPQLALQLQQLDLSGTTILEPEQPGPEAAALDNMFSGCRLKQLSLSTIGSQLLLPDMEPLAQHLTQLTVVSGWYELDYYNAALCPLTALQCLCVLKLDSLGSLTGLLQALPWLSTLHLPHTQVDDEQQLDALLAAPQLSSVQLESFTRLSSSRAAAPCSWQRLQLTGDMDCSVAAHLPLHSLTQPLVVGGLWVSSYTPSSHMSSATHNLKQACKVAVEIQWLKLELLGHNLTFLDGPHSLCCLGYTHVLLSQVAGLSAADVLTLAWMSPLCTHLAFDSGRVQPSLEFWQQLVQLMPTLQQVSFRRTEGAASEAMCDSLQRMAEQPWARWLDIRIVTLDGFELPPCWWTACSSKAHEKGCLTIGRAQATARRTAHRVMAKKKRKGSDKKRKVTRCEITRRSCWFHCSVSFRPRQATTGSSRWLGNEQASGPCVPALCVPALFVSTPPFVLACQNGNFAWLQVIKVPEGAVLRGCKKTRRKLRDHLRLRAEIHSQLRVIASLFVLRIFLTCLVGYPTPGSPSAPQPPAVQPPQPPDAPPLPPLPSRAPAQPAPAQPASMECDTDSDCESDCDSDPEPQSDSQSESESEPEPVAQPPQRRCSARLAAMAPAAPTGPPLPLDCEDPLMLRQLKDFCSFFANPNFKTCYNQLQRRHVRNRHPMLMPAFEDPSNQALVAKLQELGSINFKERIVKLYAKAARAKLGWSGEEAQLFIRMACGYGINAHSSELKAATLDKGHVADLVEEAKTHRRLLGMKKEGSLQDTLPLPCRMRHAVHVCRLLERWQQPHTPPVPGQPKRGKRRGVGPRTLTCPPPFTLTPMAKVGVQFIKVDSRVLHGVCRQLGLTKETRAAFTAEPTLSHHWARWFNTNKLRNKEFHFERLVDTDGVSVCVHYTRPLPPPPAPPPPAASSTSTSSRPSAAAAAAHAVGLPHIGRGIAEVREFVFDPDTQIGVGIDPGVTQAVSAASGVWDPATGQLKADQLRRWKLTKGEVKHASGLNNARRDTQRWLAPIKPHLQHLAAASSAGTSLEANLKHITVTLATWDAVWEVYLDPKWARQRLRLYGAQDRALERFFNKLEEGMEELSMKRHGHAKQLVVFFGAATIGTAGGWGADAVLRACRKVVCRPRGKDQDGGRVVLVDEHRTSRVSSAVNGQQPCEVELNTLSATRPAGWRPPAGQVEERLVRPAWSQERGQPVRGLVWCPVVAPRRPPQAPRSSQEATQAAASEPGPSTPQPAKRSKRTKAEPGAAEPTKGKAQGKAAKAKPAPQPGRWLDRDCNAALNMQRIGESRWRPLELCFWPEQGRLPAKGKEYPGLGYKRLRDKPPKAQEQQQQPAEAQ